MATIELGHAGLHCESDVTIPAKFGNQVLGRYSSDPLLIAGRFLLIVRSMLERPPLYDFARAKTYLNSLGLRLGLIANFGKKQFQIYGVSPD